MRAVFAFIVAMAMSWLLWGAIKGIVVPVNGVLKQASEAVEKGSTR